MVGTLTAKDSAGDALFALEFDLTMELPFSDAVAAHERAALQTRAAAAEARVELLGAELRRADEADTSL